MSTQRLVIRITFLAVFAMAARISVDSDTWWHLRAGEWMVEHREILRADPFSYTRASEPWAYPGWLVQVPMALIFRTAGPAGLNLWVAGMATLAFWFVWRAMEGTDTTHPGVFLKAFVIVLAAATSGVYWAARPYMVTFVLAAVFLWILEDFRWRRADRLWWLPALMVLWANSHGGFAVGFILWGVYGVGEGVGWLGERVSRGAREQVSETASQRIRNTRSCPEQSRRDAIKRMLLIGGLMLIAVTLNPSGPVMLLYPLKTVSIGALQDFIQEWQSPNFHDAQVQPFAWLLLLTLGAVGASQKGLALVDFLLVAGFAYLGLLAGRNVSLFALAAPVVLARHARVVVDRWAGTLGIGFSPGCSSSVRMGRVRSPVRGWVNRILLGVLFLAVLAKLSLVVPLEKNQRAFRDGLPVDAITFLQEARPQGRLFNSYNWGAYLLWALPEYPVFVDGRTDLYNDEIIGQWFQVVWAEDGWQGVLDRWDVNLVLLEPGLPVVGRLKGEGWSLLYGDEIAVVYGR